MLQFILGSAKSGKTTYIEDKITELCKIETGAIMLIVPEQFSFEAEKKLFKRLGSNEFQRVKVISFTRLSGEIFKTYGSFAGKYANECAKAVIMDRAIEQVSDELVVYKKSVTQKSFCSTMLDTITELKNAGIEPNELKKTVGLLNEGHLKSKLNEISLIYGVYDAILKTTYLDPLDDILRATKILQNEDYFSEYTIFIDEFKGFTANEAGILKIMFRDSIDVYLSLCLDLTRANENDNSVFSSLYDTYNTLTRYARQVNVKIKPPIALNQGHFLTNELNHIEQNIFSTTIHRFDFECNAIKAVLCPNEYDEVEYVLSTICMLVQDIGYSYSDIAIISRDIASYNSILQPAFKKYNIPYFSDSVVNIANKPLIRFVQNLLSCITKGYTSENILGMLKCSMTGFSVEEVAELENYLYIWDVKSKQWQEKFTSNPRGYKESFTKNDIESLDRINVMRGFINDCLTAFKEDIKNADGIEFCSAIVKVLENINAKEQNEKLISGFLADGNFEFAEDYSRVWEILMELLDTIAVTVGKLPIKAKRFQELFSLVCETYDMGSLPQVIDTVIVGSADRIRTVEKKIVLVLGANENVFPLVTPTVGVFTDKERSQLINMDINISKPSVDKLKEERFIVYKTITSPTQKLYITARKADISGAAMTESIIFSQLKKMFPHNTVISLEEISGEYFCRSKQSAFSYLAKSYCDNTKLNSSIKQVLNEDTVYQNKLLKLEAIKATRDFSIDNKANAIDLFGKEMSISPTRVEGFYQCHFKYFCEHGMRAYPLKKAELNPLETGTLIHNILYIVTSQVDLKNSYDEKSVKKLIKTELDRYIETVMGGVQDKTKRFLYLYNRMRLSIFKIVERLHYELLQSEFVPCAFEYEISEKSEVTPLKLYGDNDAVINVFGKIDRVDSYVNKNGEKYIRIVDYKSGKKEFNLNDVLYGLNLQMLIYLHCITENGRGDYKNTLPAGILYMPASEQSPSLPRDATDEKIRLKKLEGYKMNGLLIDEPTVLQAMEGDMNGIFIPVAVNQNGGLSASSQKSLVSLTQLSKINKYLDNLIIKMANELHNGRIEAIPIKESCSYCNYRGVCGVNKTSQVKEYVKYDTNLEVVNIMMQEDTDGKN